MIKSSMGLKANVRNAAGNDDRISKAYIRTFFMERFMERVSVSKYREKFILKGGMLVSSLLGIDARATMDIDTTVMALPLTVEEIKKTVDEISNIDLGDNVSFMITGVDTIMDDFEYPGIRVRLEGHLERIKQPLKIDISTDDVITPGAIEYKYRLLLENRSIRLYTYNIETMLAEKMQTIISRGLANTRMRDFYDVYELSDNTEFSLKLVADAFEATCKKRGTFFTVDKIEQELYNITNSLELKKLWSAYSRKNYFVESIEYEELIIAIGDLIRKVYK